MTDSIKTLFESTENPQTCYFIEHFSEIARYLKRVISRTLLNDWPEKFVEIITSFSLEDYYHLLLEIIHPIFHKSLEKLEKYRNLPYYTTLKYLCVLNPRVKNLHQQFYVGSKFSICSIF